MQPAEFEEAKLLWKMFYADDCFKRARAAAEYIVAQKLEHENPIMYPLVTSVYVLYGRPFRHSNAVGKLDEKIIPPKHLDLHRELLKSRDKVYAHADGTGFELPECGQANQVRAIRTQTELRLFATQFHARFTLMPDVIKLCRALEEKTSYHVRKLFMRYVGRVPRQVGEYAINIYDEKGDFFRKEKPILLKSPGG
jgi:hypothetical protein